MNLWTGLAQVALLSFVLESLVNGSSLESHVPRLRNKCVNTCATLYGMYELKTFEEAHTMLGSKYKLLQIHKEMEKV